MATSADYANWLRNNQDKRGTPNYKIVLQAYQEAALEENQAAQAPAPVAPAAPAQRTGFGAAIGKGLESLIGTTTTGVQAATGDANQAAELALKRAAASPYADQVSWDKVKEVYATQGALAAALEVARQVPLAIGEQLPQLGVSLGATAAGAKLGALTSPVTGPVGPIVGGGLGFLSSTLPSIFGSNIERQAAEQQQAGKPIDINVGDAASAAALQTGLEAAGTLIPLGRTVVSKLFGPQVEVLLKQGKEKAAEALARESLGKVIAKGAAVGVAAEVPTEVIQQALERAQAGLPVLSDDALAEYAQATYQSVLVGAPLGTAGRAVSRSEARTAQAEAAQAEAAKQRKAAREAAEAQKKSPEYLLKLDADYQAAVKRVQELQAAVKDKPGKDALPDERLAHKQREDELKAFVNDTMRPLTAEYTPRKAEIAQLKERKRVEGMTPEDYMLEQMGIKVPKITAPATLEEAAAQRETTAPPVAPETTYAQQQLTFAQRQGVAQALDADEQRTLNIAFLMQDPAMAQRLVETKTPIPEVSKKESDAILGGIKLQLQEQAKERAKQERTATQAELQQRQEDLKAQQPKEEADPLAMWKSSVEQTEEQATEELLRPNFETLRPIGPATVTVAPGITPIQNPTTLLKRIDSLVAARDQAAAAADSAFTSGNKELGIKKSQEREAAQTALNNLEQTEGAPRALMSLRKAQDTALMNAAQLIDDLKAGRTLGGPEAGTASSTPQTLINQINRERDAFITATVQEAAATRRLFAKALPQEEATKAANEIREVFNEWVTRSMAQSLKDVNWVDRLVAEANARGAVAGKELRDAPWVQQMKQDFIRAQMTDALAKRLGRQRMEEIAKGTAELKGAETELPVDTRRAVESKASVDFDRLLRSAQEKALAQSTDPRPLEERRFGSYRAATAVLQEQLQDIAAKLKQVPRAPQRVEPTLKMQFPETEAAKVAEAKGETAQTLEGQLRRRRDYAQGLIDQVFQTRKVPGIAQTLLTRAQDFLPTAPNTLLDAVENVADRILRGQNVERSDLRTLRDELRAASARPGEAEVAGERVGQRELFPAEERRALAPKEERGALGLIREKPEAFQAVRAKEAAKAARVAAATQRSEQLTQDIRKELERIDKERQAALEQRVEERRDSLQSAWRSAVKKAKNLVLSARKAAQKPQIKALKKEIDAIRKGGIEGLNKESLDRLLATRAELDKLSGEFDTVVEAAEFLPIAQADKWVAYERGSLEQAQKALAETRTPQTVSAVQQQQAALQRAEQARLQSLKGEEKAAEAARMRAAQTGLGLPGQRRVEGRVERIEPEQTAAQRAAEAQEARAQAREESAQRAAEREAERTELEQRVLDLGTQVAEREAAQKRARTPASKAKIQAEIDALNKDATLAQGQLDALGETKPRKKGPTMVPTGAALAKQKPLRTGYRKALEAASESLRREREGKERGQAAPWFAATPSSVYEREETIDVGGVKIQLSRGATANPSTTDSARAELKQTFPDLGRVQIYDSVDALIAANPQYKGKIPADARGFVDSAGNKAFLIAENINQGQALSVLLHEVGAHVGLKSMLGDAQYSALVNAVKSWEKRNDNSPEARVAQAARARVEAAETPASQVNDELLAYAVEEAVNAGVKPMETKSVLGRWLSQIAALFRKALEKFGLPPKALDAQGLVDMAFGAAKMEMRGQAAPAAEARTEPGEILFSRNLPTAARVANQIVGEQKGWLAKLKDNFLGMGFRTQFIDKYFPTEEALKRAGADPTKAMQAMYYLRMVDQQMHFTSQAITDGVPERREIIRRDGTKEYLIEAKPGANLKQAYDILKRKDVVKETGSADASNKLATLYMAAIRGERVGYDTLNFGRVWAQGEIKRIENELKSPKLSAEQRTVLTKRMNRLESRLDSMPTPEDIKAAKAEIDANPVLRDAFSEVRDIYNQYNRDLINFNVQTGALSKEQANKLLQENDYIPYYRIRDGVAELMIGKETPIRIGNLKDSPHLQELVGGDEPIMDFIASSVQNTSMLIDMATHNLAMRNLMFEFKDLGLATVGKVKGGNAPKGAVTFKLDGVEHFGVVDTEVLGISSDLLVKGLAGIPTMFPAFVRVMGAPARFLRRMIVASPLYMARQLFRDSLAASIASGANTVPILGALKQIGKTDVLERRGITGGQVFTGMPEDQARMIKAMQAGKLSITNGLAYLEGKAAQVDALTRRAQYDSYIQQGLSEMEATYMALESMNFSRRGLSPSVHMASTLIPFFNSQIQGLDVLYRSFRGQMPMNERLGVRRKLLTRGAMLFGLSFAYAMAMQDDEAYKNAKPEEKYGNWLVSLPGVEQPLRLPIPFELGYVFKALPEALANILSNEEGGEEAFKALKHIVQQMVPGLSNFFIPAAIKPLAEVGSGVSTYTLRDIESAREQQIEPGYRARESTTELAKAVGQMTGFSPIKLEALISGYTGQMGMALIAALSAPFAGTGEGPAPATKRPSDLPLIGTLFQPKDASGIIDLVYERMNKVRQVQETYKRLIDENKPEQAKRYAEEKADELSLASVAGAFRQQMGEITKFEREVRASTLTPDRKRAELDRARQAKIDLSKRVQALSGRTAPQAARP